MNRIIHYGLAALQALSPRDLANIHGREFENGTIPGIVSSIGSGASAVNSLVSSEPVAATSSALITTSLATPAPTTPPSGPTSDVGGAVSSVGSGDASAVSSVVGQVSSAISGLQINAVSVSEEAVSDTIAPPAVQSAVTSADDSDVGGVSTAMASILSAASTAIDGALSDVPASNVAVVSSTPIVSDVSTGIAPIVSDLSTGIVPIVSDVSTAVAPMVSSGVLSDLSTDIAPVVTPVVTPLLSDLSSAVAPLTSAVATVVSKLSTAAAPVTSAIPAIVPGTSAAPNPVGSIISGAESGLGSLLSGAGSAVSTVVPAVESIVPEITSDAIPLVTSIVPNIVTGVVPGIITSAVPGIITGVVPGIITSDVPGIITGVVPNIITGVVPDVISSIVPAVPALLSDLSVAVPTIVPALVSEATGLIGGALSDIGPIASAVPGPLGSELNSAVNQLTSLLEQPGLQTAVGQIQSEIGQINSLIAGAASGAGGILSSPGSALGGELASELGKLSSLVGGVAAPTNGLLAGLTAASGQTQSLSPSQTAFESLGALSGSQFNRKPTQVTSGALNSAGATGSVTGLFGPSGSGVNSRYPKSVLSFISNSISLAASTEVLSGSITTTLIRSVTFPVSSLVPAPSNTAYPATIFPSGYDNPLDAQGNELKGAPIRAKTILAPLMPVAAVLIFGPLFAYWLCLRRRYKAKRSRAESEKEQLADNSNEESSSGPMMVEIEQVAELGSGRSTRYGDSDSGSTYDNLSIRDADSFFDGSSVYAASVPEVSLLPRDEEAEKRRNVKFMRSNLKGFLKGGKHRYLQLIDDPNEDKEAEEGKKWFKRKK